MTDRPFHIKLFDYLSHNPFIIYGMFMTWMVVQIMKQIKLNKQEFNPKTIIISISVAIVLILILIGIAAIKIIAVMVK